MKDDPEDLFPELNPKEDLRFGNEELNPWNPKHHFRRDGPETSKAAAYKAGPTARTHEGKIVAALRRNPNLGLTINEVVDDLWKVGTPLDYAQVSRRFSNLQRIVAIYNTGQTRKTPSNCDAIVWKATISGGEALLNQEGKNQ
jgi:hypothetical protein